MRGGRLEFWQVHDGPSVLLSCGNVFLIQELFQSIADAKSGAPPKSCLIVSNVVDKCTTSETAQIPKDTYPLVVFDLSRQIISSSRKRELIYDYCCLCLNTVVTHSLIRATRALHQVGGRVSDPGGDHPHDRRADAASCSSQSAAKLVEHIKLYISVIK